MKIVGHAVWLVVVLQGCLDSSVPANEPEHLERVAFLPLLQDTKLRQQLWELYLAANPIVRRFKTGSSPSSSARLVLAGTRCPPPSCNERLSASCPTGKLDREGVFGAGCHIKLQPGRARVTVELRNQRPARQGNKRIAGDRSGSATFSRAITTTR